MERYCNATPVSRALTAIRIAPRVGFAWLDPMLGMMLAFATAASLWRRRTSGDVARIDCSMIEAILWCLAARCWRRKLVLRPNRWEPFRASRSAWCVALRRRDAWISLAVRDDRDWRALCRIVTALAPLSGLDREGRIAHATEIDTALTGWAQTQDAFAAAATLRHAGIPAAALASSVDLVNDPHLRARGFWDPHEPGVLLGLPWRASFGRAIGPAPALGADTDAVMRAISGRFG